MQSIGHQLGDLFLQAVPTVVIILLFYFILRAVFFKPLLQVMAERELRTAGARKAAESAASAAADRVRQYQESVAQARAKVYAEQEAARKQFLDQRASQLKLARSRASEQVSLAKQRVAQELASAGTELGGVVGALSDQIARRLLQTPTRRGPGAGPTR